VAGKRPILVGCAASCAVRALYRFQDKGILLLMAYVVMPEHVHVLATLGKLSDLSQTFGRWKGAAAREINLVLARSGPLWQAGFYDHAIRHDEDLRNVALYIESNPIRRGLATTAAGYGFSSAGEDNRERLLGWESVW
jgi:REP element-mobilizing transposase RayT